MLFKRNSPIRVSQYLNKLIGLCVVEAMYFELPLNQNFQWKLVALATFMSEVTLKHKDGPEEVGHAFINVRGHVPFAALYYSPCCIPSCN